MSSQSLAPPAIGLPPLPADHVDWISHVASHPDTSMHELIAPYKEYDSKLREVFAQQPEHPAIAKPNVVPIFEGREQELKIRARNLAVESEAESQCYLMPLKKADRKAQGAPAVVQSLKEFQTNFQLFSESSLVDMDWSNVVVAGSAVVTSLLPVPEKHNTSKRALREYYHQKLAPASDVDLFLYGLTEEQAVEKIKQIEQRIRDSILTETTTVRTKNAVTIVSQYPTRHVQIVLRIYRSISEILTGFDVDCSCAAYDGTQVYASPRALAAYMTQINTIDLTRRSPSYENRLSKYSHRGFEIYWPLLDRTRIDPTLFERSFGRTLGLARLLVLEKLPKNTDREAYVDQRRAERGRPTINRWAARKLKGNMKEEHDDEVAEWVETDEVSDYHTFTIPYGPKYHARKIERLLYAKDLLLNAEWNRPKERETTLHRHPAFFGNAVDVIGDCCGYCPEPVTPEDQEIAGEESKTYVSGQLSFIKDNPGRQAIGSFNPLTDDDWTEMAYVGNTARLCQAIIEGDLEHVKDWLSQEGADPNRRDYTGRTPLHLAVSISTPEVVQALIEGGARIVARLVDGRTALHLAAMRGETAMVKALLTKSEANEEKEAEKEAVRRSAREADRRQDQDMPDVAGASLQGIMQAEVGQSGDKDGDEDDGSDEDSDVDMLDDESENADATTENSIVRIDRNKREDAHETLPDNMNDDEPDVYDINVLAWDAPVSALHLAIANGHKDVVKALVQDFGADVLLPIKLVNDYNKSARAAILPVVLALHLPLEEAKEMTTLLVSLGASPAQADVENVTALQYFTAHSVDLLSTMIAANRPAAQRAVGHLSMCGTQYNPGAQSILQCAIKHRDIAAIDVLLELGAKPEIDFATYMTSFKSRWDATGNSEHNEEQFRQSFTQPVFDALRSEMLPTVLKLLDAGADVNSLTGDAWRIIKHLHHWNHTGDDSLLDCVRSKIEKLRKFVDPEIPNERNAYEDLRTGRMKRHPPVPLKDDAEYLQDYDPQSYAHWLVSIQIEQAKAVYEHALKSYNDWKSFENPEGTQEKITAAKAVLREFEELERQLLARGAKTFKELYPDLKLPENQEQHNMFGYNYEPPPPEAWSPLLSFHLPDLSDERRAAYVKLFQACWDGDLTTVKELTLAVWSGDQSPLKIAVQDTQNFSPFSLAVLRKHFDVAKAVLEIAHAQYAPDDKKGQVKHSIQPADEEDDESDGNDDFHIYSEIVDDRFTVENIGEVHNQVKSNVTPLVLASWPCPVHNFLEGNDSILHASSTPVERSVFRYRRRWGQRRPNLLPSKIMKDAANDRTYYVQPKAMPEEIPEVDVPTNLFQFAVYLNDSELLHFLIAMGEDCTTRRHGDADEISSTFFRFAEADFLYAIHLGRVELLKEIIIRTGTGIPLDDLVKKSGIVIPEKPKFYQGLSVHGKKRADWANAGREAQGEEPADQRPPLLHAARFGSLESVEWFMSDATLRCYSQFADSHRGDIRIQNLANSEDGIEASITKWLNLRSHLVMHCVVLGKTTEASLQLLRHLCKTQPQALHHRSASGMTPLHLAFHLHRVEMIKVLLEGGAEQTCRNNAGDNIVHSILNHNSLGTEKDMDRVRELFKLIDPRLLPSLFTERTTDEPGAATPLARCVRNRIGEKKHNLPRLLIELSKGEDLGIVNGEGDTPLHAAARYGHPDLLRIMLECRPELLFRENATGRTPYEVAEDAYLSIEVFGDPPSHDASEQRYHRNNAYIRRHALRPQSHKPVLEREPKDFVEEPKDMRSDVELVWEVCKEFAAKAKGTKRKLVSLVEANEVAKRLARKKGSRDEAEEKNAEKKEGEEDGKGDEVDVWLWMGLQADKLN
jgi:ankyrin repeat protein